MNDYTKARREKALRIINDPAPTEKFTLVYPIYPSNLMRVYNGAQKEIGTFPVDASMRQMFGGRTKIIVKAKIISGQLEIMKVL